MDVWGTYGIDIPQPWDDAHARPRELARHTLWLMCGRYAATRAADELIEAFDVEQDHTGEPSRSVLKNPQSPPPGEPDWNMAPSQAGAPSS